MITLSSDRLGCRFSLVHTSLQSLKPSPEGPVATVPLSLTTVERVLKPRSLTGSCRIVGAGSATARMAGVNRLCPWFLICPSCWCTPTSGGVPRQRREDWWTTKVVGIAHQKAGETAGPRKKQGHQSWSVSQKWFCTKKAVLRLLGTQEERTPKSAGRNGQLRWGTASRSCFS